MNTFKLLQWSDSHGDNDAVSYTNEVIASAKNNVDAVLHCGDICEYEFENGYGIANLHNSMLILGNHDCIKDSGTNPKGYIWTDQPTQAQLYDAFFRPFIHEWGCVGNETETWWYKDYPEKNILLVGMNDAVFGSIEKAEIEWLEWINNFAKENERKVIIAKHAPMIPTTFEMHNFTKTGAYRNYSIYDDARFYIWSYENNVKLHNKLLMLDCDLRLIITGHTHCDALYFIENKYRRKIPVCTITSTLNDNSYQDVPRTNEGINTGRFAMNQIELTEDEKLRIYRLGSNTSQNGLTRKGFIWDMKKGKFVVNMGGRLR